MVFFKKFFAQKIGQENTTAEKIVKHFKVGGLVATSGGENYLITEINENERTIMTKSSDGKDVRPLFFDLAFNLNPEGSTEGATSQNKEMHDSNDPIEEEDKFRKGQGVIVKRNSGVNESGWVIDEIDTTKGTAKLIKAIGNTISQKNANLEQLREWANEGVEINSKITEEEKDAFSFFGLPHGASPDEINKKYKEMAKKYHPDVVNAEIVKLKNINLSSKNFVEIEKKKLNEAKLIFQHLNNYNGVLKNRAEATES